jgi:pyruvate formate lyase activating enzyme
VVIKGWVRNSFIDFPDHISAVVFTGGCNFRCPMCHNADLVLHSDELPNVDKSQIWEFLKKRSGVLDGLVVSGGEPTIQNDLIPFIKRVKSLGYDVKLDTNGSRPRVIQMAINSGFVDFIALDIKAPPVKYPELAGTSQADPNIIVHSLEIICESHVPFELRTTVVPGMLGEKDIGDIARWLASIIQNGHSQGHYVLQQFRGKHTLDPSLSRLIPYKREQLLFMADLARQWLPSVRVRGI